MAQSTPDAPPAPAPDASEGGDEERTRLPRVVVRMSDGMKAALDEYCKTHDLVATQLGRELLATRIGWDLSKDPDAPGAATRSAYADDAAREQGKLRNRKQSGLLRKVLHAAHLAQIKKRPEQLAVAQRITAALVASKPPIPELDAFEAELEAAIKAGR